MQKYFNDRVSNLFAGLVLISPIIILYFWIFISSMEVAPDRLDYLDIMAYPFEGRGEPLLHLISYILDPIFYNPIYKLVFIQFFFVILLFITLFRKLKAYNLENFLKLIIVAFLFLGVFSNILGVQLRIGYATIIFLFIYFFLERKPSFFNFPIYLVPCFMHSGLIFAVISLYSFQYLKIDNKKKFFIFLLLSITIMTFFIKFLPLIFDILSISNYYLFYLEEDSDFGRALPFSVIFYLIFSFFGIIFFSRKNSKDISFWYGNSGLILVYTGLVLDFYIAFKMLVPISAFLYIYIIDKITIESKSSKLLLITMLMLMPLTYLMLIKQVGLM